MDCMAYLVKGSALLPGWSWTKTQLKNLRPKPQQ